MIESSAAEPAPFAAAPPPALRRLFFGDDGLRAGWSLLVFIALIVLLGRAFTLLNHRLHLFRPGELTPQVMTPRITILGDAIQLGMIALATVIMSLVERRPLARYGLPLRRALPDFLTGLVWGLVMLSLLIATLYFAHALAFDGVALHGVLALEYAGEWAFAFLLVGLTEEFLTRGYIQYTVARGIAGLTRAISPSNPHSHLIGFWVAAFFFSVCLFMAGHIGNSGETPWGIAAVGVAGAVFAFSLYRTGSLWWAIGIHTAWDWAQSCLYGTSDSGITATGHILSTHPVGPAWRSGGATGPEGSIFVIPALLLIALVIHVTLPRRPYPLTTDQAPPPGDSHLHL